MLRLTTILIIAAVSAVMLLLLSGCYYIGQGVRLVAAYGGARDIDTALLSTDLGDDERALLVLVKDIKRFAVEELGLEENRNYSTYKRIDADYLATVVSACPADSFKQYQWTYPVMGKMPYKGFFNRDGALAEQRRLEKEGYDVLVRDVDAFSTLGFFSDPVFSYMKSYPVFHLAELLIHEQTHATVFSKASVDFSENLASFTGTRGALEYIARKEGPESAAYRHCIEEKADEAAYYELARALWTSLDELYRGTATRAEKLVAKAAIISAWKEDFLARYDKLFKTARFSHVPRMQIDNATLCTMMNYVSDLSLFERFLEKEGGSISRMMAVAGELVAKPGDPFANLHAHMGESIP